MSIREKLKQWKRFAAGATAAVLCAGPVSYTHLRAHETL